MKILITGSNGQLGNELQKIIATGTAEIGTVSDVIKTAEVDAVDVEKLDITNLEQVNLCLLSRLPFAFGLSHQTATVPESCPLNIEE